MTLAELVESDEDLKLGRERNLEWIFEDGSKISYQKVCLLRFEGPWNMQRQPAYLTVREKQDNDRNLVESSIFHEYTKDSIDAVDYAFNSMQATAKIRKLRMERLEKKYK